VPEDVDESLLAAGTPPEGYEWKHAVADKKGMVNLSRALDNSPDSVAYAYAEIESVHAREAVLSYIGDDGIKIWLNGAEVLDNDVQRKHDGSFTAYLKEGVNRLLIKVSQVGSGGWGYSVSVPKANF